MLNCLKKSNVVTKKIWSLNIVSRQKFLGIPSVERLAELAELPYPTVRDIVAGTSEGGYEKREKIARALQWTVADLYKGAAGADGAKPIPDVQFAVDLLSKFATVPPDIRNLVMTILYKDESYLASSPKTFRQKAIDFLKAALPR
jgi:hypothetical protein